MHRKEILEKAVECTCGQRDVEYGSPEENLQNIADLWTVYLTCKYGDKHFGIGREVRFTAEDQAWMMTLLKMARTFAKKPSTDTYVDAAAYAAIAGEVAE